MNRALILLTMLALLSAPGPAQRPEKPSFKGVELYSWPTDSGWRFVLLPGTNRQKQTEDVMAVPACRDVESLKRRLAGLAVGEQIYWFHGDRGGFVYPDSAVIEELRGYCEEIGVTLNTPEGVGK